MKPLVFAAMAAAGLAFGFCYGLHSMVALAALAVGFALGFYCGFRLDPDRSEGMTAALQEIDAQ